MAKTDFSSGTVVSSAFLDSLYLAGGGHVHDGDSENDGHASKVNLTSGSHVTGTLPEDMVGSHVHDGGSGAGHRAKIDLSNGNHVTGILPEDMVGDHVHDGGSGAGHQAKVQLVDCSDYYYGNGVCQIPIDYITESSPPQIAYYWIRLGNLVLLRFRDNLVGTSDTGTLKITPDGTWPSHIQVGHSALQPLLVLNGAGAVMPGWIELPTADSSELVVGVQPASGANGISASNFETGGQKGVWAQTLCYHRV